MFRRIASILAAAVCLSLTSCKLPPTVAELQRKDDEGAKKVVQEYSQAFIDIVDEAYGDSASLTDIECVRIKPDRYDPGYVSYTEELKGTITIDGREYEALYDCRTGTLRDSVHTEAICSELADSLPLDKDKIIETVYPESGSDWDCGEQLKFPCGVKSYDDAITWDERAGTTIIIWIYTSEDVSGLTEAELEEIPEIQKLIDSTSVGKVTIVSLEDTEALDDLKEEMKKSFSTFDRLGYETTKAEAVSDFFRKYHITGAAVVRNKYSYFEEDDVPRGVELVKIEE